MDADIVYAELDVNVLTWRDPLRAVRGAKRGLHAVLWPAQPRNGLVQRLAGLHLQPGPRRLHL